MANNKSRTRHEEKPKKKKDGCEFTAETTVVVKNKISVFDFTCGKMTTNIDGGGGHHTHGGGAENSPPRSAMLNKKTQLYRRQHTTAV